MANVTISRLQSVTTLGPTANIPAMSGNAPAVRITAQDFVANVVSPAVNLGNYSGNISSFTRQEPANIRSQLTGFGSTFRGNVLLANAIPVPLGSYANGDPIWPDLGSISNPWNAVFSLNDVRVGGPTGVSISSETGTATFTNPSTSGAAGISAGDIDSDVITANSAVLAGALRSGSIITGNITSNANITTATGNISANYFLGNAAFLTGLPQNYGNADVANYLASNSNVEITVGIANIATQGNIAAGYFLGNGAFLTGITASGGGANISQYSGAVNTFNPIATTAEIAAVLPVGTVPNLGDFFVDTSNRVNNQQPIYVFVNSQWRQLLTALG